MTDRLTVAGEDLGEHARPITRVVELPPARIREPEPVPDLVCPMCDGTLDLDVGSPAGEIDCNACHVSWRRDGTGGHRWPPR